MDEPMEIVTINGVTGRNGTFTIVDGPSVVVLGYYDSTAVIAGEGATVIGFKTSAIPGGGVISVVNFGENPVSFVPGESVSEGCLPLFTPDGDPYNLSQYMIADFVRVPIEGRDGFWLKLP